MSQSTGRYFVATAAQVRFAYHHGRSAEISPNLYRLLADADGELSIGDLSRRTAQSTEQIEGLVSELRTLWSDRFVDLDPPEQRVKLAALNPRRAAEPLHGCSRTR